MCSVTYKITIMIFFQIHYYDIILLKLMSAWNHYSTLSCNSHVGIFYCNIVIYHLIPPPLRKKIWFIIFWCYKSIFSWKRLFRGFVWSKITLLSSCAKCLDIYIYSILLKLFLLIDFDICFNTFNHKGLGYVQSHHIFFLGGGGVAKNKILNLNTADIALNIM